MPKRKEFFYAIPKHVIHELGIAPVLDMLRYDGATIECNAPEGWYLFRIEGHGPHRERWTSFGVTNIVEGNTTLDINLLITIPIKKG
jgi:hypothetical protein